MSQKILIKKSTVVGKVPVSGDLDIGELAVNTADSHLYTKHSDNSVKKLTHTQNTDTSLDHGGANAVTAATITGHFATHPAPTTRDARNDPAGAAAGVQANLNTHTTTHPAPTTRDARNEAANANIQAHVTSAHAPSDANNYTHPGTIQCSANNYVHPTGNPVCNAAPNANNYAHPNHSGDVTSVGHGAQTIANNAVTNAKAADMAVNTIKGRIAVGTGDPQDLTAANVRTIINVANGATAAGATGDAHAGTSHAPSNAQKNVQSDWNQTTVGADDFIKNKPTISSSLFELDLNDDIMPTS